MLFNSQVIITTLCLYSDVNSSYIPEITNYSYVCMHVFLLYIRKE